MYLPYLSLASVVVALWSLQALCIVGQGQKMVARCKSFSAADEVDACLFNLSEHVLQAVDLWGTK